MKRPCNRRPATGEQLQKATGFVRAEARQEPVAVTYHGRPELMIPSVEDYALLRQNRKIAMTIEDMPASQIEPLAANRMGTEHIALDVLMDEIRALADAGAWLGRPLRASRGPATVAARRRTPARTVRA